MKNRGDGGPPPLLLLVVLVGIPHALLVGIGDSYVSQMSVCFVVPKHIKEWSIYGKHSKTRREQLSTGSVPWV